jgi:hypothetical protein
MWANMVVLGCVQALWQMGTKNAKMAMEPSLHAVARTGGNTIYANARPRGALAPS